MLCIENRCMPLMCAIAVSLTVATRLMAAGEHAGGTYVSDITWSSDTVFVDSTVIIDSAATLSIAPGTVAVFYHESFLLVRGRLLAEGTVSDSIVFTGSSTSIKWRGIRFSAVAQSADTSRLSYCRISLAENEFDGMGGWGGAISVVDFSRLAVSHCAIVNNGGYGMYNGGGVCCKGSSPVFIDCSISFNDLHGVHVAGAGMYLEGSNPELVNVIFDNNISDGSLAKSAGLVCRAGSSPVLINCLFIRNKTDGAASDGGAVTCEGSSPRFINCTIAMNGDSNCTSFAWAMSLHGGSDPQVVNTIFWGNGRDPVLIHDTSCTPAFRNCMFEAAAAILTTLYNKTGTYTDTLTGDPLFVNAEEGDFRLGSSSPCINAGTADTSGLGLPPFDLDGNDRIYNAVRIDIGAYEFQGVPAGVVKLAPARSDYSQYGQIITALAVPAADRFVRMKTYGFIGNLMGQMLRDPKQGWRIGNKAAQKVIGQN